MTRVVSLVPSVTETLLAWGVIPAAVTRFCEHPELPAVGGTKDPDVAAIIALAPDLVVMCDEENRLEDADALTGAGVAVHSLQVRTVGDVGPQLARLATVLGVAAADPAPAPPPEPTRLEAFVPIWRQARRGAVEYRTIGDDTYGASVLRACGVGNVFGAGADRYPVTSLDEAAARGPDVVVAPSEPYPFAERHRSELAAVAPVVFVDGQDLFWWGARTPAAVARLSQVMGGLSPRGSRDRP